MGRGGYKTKRAMIPIYLGGNKARGAMIQIYLGCKKAKRAMIQIYLGGNKARSIIFIIYLAFRNQTVKNNASDCQNPTIKQIRIFNSFY